MSHGFAFLETLCVADKESSDKGFAYFRVDWDVKK